MILTHGANSLVIGGGGDYVEIGGRKYPVVKIGNQLWMAENLDYKWTGLIVGTSGSSTTDPRANYYSNDEATYGVNGNKYGLLYNFPAAKYLDDNKATLFPSGWHVPSVGEFNTLIANSGSSQEESAYNLKSESGWSSNGNGIDLYGFKLVPSGNYWSDFGNVGAVAFFWSKTIYENDPTYAYYAVASSLMQTEQGGVFTKNNEYSLRLVKDAT